jgi:hypothetical protein
MPDHEINVFESNKKLGSMKKLNVREGYNDLIRSTLFDIFMYIDGSDDTLCDAVSNWQDNLEDEEVYHDVEYWIEVLGEQNNRMDLVKKMKNRKRDKNRNITLKIKDSLADIFDLIGDKKIPEIIRAWASTLSDKEVWHELEKCLQELFHKKEQYLNEHPEEALWISEDGKLKYDSWKVLNEFKKHPASRKGGQKNMSLDNE